MKKKRFENFKKERFKSLDEDLDDDLENYLENANFMNIKFINLHVIFFFDLILNCLANKHFKIKHHLFFSRF